jgi:hypothetical protein
MRPTDTVPTVIHSVWRLFRCCPVFAQLTSGIANRTKEVDVPQKRANVKNEKQYEALKDKGMSKERAARIANSPGASSRGGEESGSGGSPSQGGTTPQKKAAGRKGGKATARKRS